MGCKFKLSDLPPAMIAMIRPAERAALGLSPSPKATMPPKPQDAPRATPQGKDRPRTLSGPNKTEERFRREKLDGRDARYEALTFRLANGHRYTPDWVVFGVGVMCVEVKGAYRFGSHGRARLAFDQARSEFPAFGWAWAQWGGKAWTIEVNGERV